MMVDATEARRQRRGCSDGGENSSISLTISVFYPTVLSSCVFSPRLASILGFFRKGKGGNQPASCQEEKNLSASMEVGVEKIES
ncbi:hypothetical protein LR48_Vigan04g156300 [Vigna angularis]|uniref:Uncharacterized protein n=1 Tax=Phaseolus angularis TaxID=3914 RepID=A0A0L9UEL0_PHAAN|nr:hypothetical protein LR48_Vigan04g156300 [Vigna angularis]